MMIPIWVKLLGVLAICGGIFFGGYRFGASHWEVKYANLQRDSASAAQAAQEKYDQVLADKNAQIQKANDDFLRSEKAAALNDLALRTRIASGSLRLSVPIDSSSCSMPAPDNSGKPAPKARAELDPATAESLVSITQDGDKAIRECNQLIEVIRHEQETSGF